MLLGMERLRLNFKLRHLPSRSPPGPDLTPSDTLLAAPGNMANSR